MTICAWCKRIINKNDTLTQVTDDEVAPKKSILRDTHGICEKCKTEVDTTFILNSISTKKEN